MEDGQGPSLLGYTFHLPTLRGKPCSVPLFALTAATFLLIACSGDRPAPVAPLGKANTQDLSDWFAFIQRQTLAATAVDTLDSVAVEGFDIELVFLHSFEDTTRAWIEQVVSEWEPFFNEHDDYIMTAQSIQLFNSTQTITDSTRIDDIRIYVDNLTTAKADQLSSDSSWGEALTLAAATVNRYRDNGQTPLVAAIYLNEAAHQRQILKHGQYAAEKTWKLSVQHELAHAFGIGTSPAWTDNITWRSIQGLSQDNQAAYYTGANALREYQNRNVEGLPSRVREDGIYVGATDFGIKKMPIHFSMMSGMHWSLFLIYYLRDNDRPNICRVALGTFEDIGWSVNYELGMAEYIEGFSILPCWFDDPNNMHLCGDEETAAGKALIVEDHSFCAGVVQRRN